jgi:hypothetical protein
MVLLTNGYFVFRVEYKDTSPYLPFIDAVLFEKCTLPAPCHSCKKRVLSFLYIKPIEKSALLQSVSPIYPPKRLQNAKDSVSVQS